MLRDANLSDEQKAAIKAIRDADQTPGPDLTSDGRLRRELQAELFADAPNAGKITALQQQLSESQSARLARQIATDQAVTAPAGA